MAKTVAVKTESVPHTTRVQRCLIVEWLELPANFKLITGSAAINSKVTAGVKLKRTDAYKALAETVSKGSGIAWTPEHGKNRYESYLKLYKKTKQESERTGWGLTDEDTDKGITTIDLKLDAMCPYFERLDALFGDRQNVTPFETVETGVEAEKDELSYEEEDNPLLLFNDALNPIDLDREGSTQGIIMEKRTVSSSDTTGSSCKKVKTKTDLTTVYAQNSSNMLKLNNERLQFEMNRFTQEREIAKEKMEMEKENVKTTGRITIIQTLIAQGILEFKLGKSAEEIKEYLSLLANNQ